MSEEWKEIQIQNFPALSVSTLGRIRYPSGRTTLGTTTKNGYKQVVLRANGVQKTFLVNRLVAIAFIKNPLDLPHTNHLDARKTNNEVSNLEWCTQKQNVAHARSMGLIHTCGDAHWTRRNPERVKRGAASNLSINPLKGSQHSQAKLTEGQVYAIRRARAKGKKLQDIAACFGVSIKTVSLIHKRQRWGHLP